MSTNPGRSILSLLPALAASPESLKQFAQQIETALSLTSAGFSGSAPLTAARRAAHALEWDLEDAFVEDWRPPAGTGISALRLSGWVETVETTRFAMVARQADDLSADELVVHVPMRLVSHQDRRLVVPGAHVCWNVKQIDRGGSRVETISELAFVEPQALTAAELDEIRQRASEFDAMIPDSDT